MNWRKLRRWVAIVLCVGLIVLLLSSWFVGSELVASANRSVEAAPVEFPVVESTIQSDSGSKIATWFVQAENSTATIILLHPIRADRRSMLGRAKLFFASGYSIVMIDLQAHGESPGENITLGYLERHDVRAAIAYARKLNPKHRIGIVGCSLGGAAAVLGSPLGVDAMVLESVYPTISEAIHNRISMRLGPLSYVLTPLLLCQIQPRLGISPSELRPIDRIAQVQCPVLFAGGDLDQRTTLSETQRLFDAATAPKQLVIFAGAAHTDLLAYNSDLYRDKILGFLNGTLIPQ